MTPRRSIRLRPAAGPSDVAYLPNSTLRACDYPRCGATFDAATGPLGQTLVWCWRLHKTFGLHLCPDHSGLWGGGEGPHVPRLNYAERTTSCSCGEHLPGITLGEMAQAYLAHLETLEGGLRPVDAEPR